MKNLLGSNQYKARTRLLSDKTWRDIWFIAFMACIGIWLSQKPIIRPCPDTGCFIKVVEASELVTPTPTPLPELAQIIAYIAKTFEPEGKHVVVQAINCFYSESGLRSDAKGINRNGTDDVGVAQINSIHGMSEQDRKDYKKNIDKAYKIYKSRGNNFDAWYGKLCH